MSGSSAPTAGAGEVAGPPATSPSCPGDDHHRAPTDPLQSGRRRRRPSTVAGRPGGDCHAVPADEPSELGRLHLVSTPTTRPATWLVDPDRSPPFAHRFVAVAGRPDLGRPRPRSRRLSPAELARIATAYLLMRRRIRRLRLRCRDSTSFLKKRSKKLFFL